MPLQRQVKLYFGGYSRAFVTLHSPKICFDRIQGSGSAFSSEVLSQGAGIIVDAHNSCMACTGYQLFRVSWSLQEYRKYMHGPAKRANAFTFMPCHDMYAGHVLGCIIHILCPGGHCLEYKFAKATVCAIRIVWRIDGSSVPSWLGRALCPCPTITRRSRWSPWDVREVRYDIAQSKKCGGWINIGDSVQVLDHILYTATERFTKNREIQYLRVQEAS